jgi:hypothetical protein
MLRKSSIAVISLVALAPGCKTWIPAIFNHGEGVNGDKVLIVPFSEPKQGLWYGESPNGRTVAESIKVWIRSNADPNFPEGPEVKRVLEHVMNTTEQHISADHWKKLTAGLGIKYVVYGEIEDMSLSRPDRIGTLDPTVQASYRVVDVEIARIVHEIEEFTVDFARGYDHDLPIIDLGADTTQARAKLLSKLGAQIGKDLYGYYRE